MPGFRIEKDSLGEVQVPSENYWGAQTERARLNFQISSYRIPQSLLRALIEIKGAAAQVNRDLGLLAPDLADAIIKAADEAKKGSFDQEFPLDVFQTGSGTSWNMNANEVLASRANEILVGIKGGKSPVHPNDHVNMGQSSNDVIPTAMNIACRVAGEETVKSLETLSRVFLQKSYEFRDVLKIGRTHLQDAVPMSLGAEFSAFSRQIQLACERLRGGYSRLEELAIGGTALGTGINTHPEFASRMSRVLSDYYGFGFRKAANFYEAISARDVQVELIGNLNTTAVSLMKIANDLRLLSSGPRTGFGEIILPSLQPGSSIMPGKVNPVILEMTIQACAHIMGKATSVTIGGQNAPLQLNIMMPLISFECLSALDLLKNVALSLSDKCIKDIEVDRKACELQIERSLALVTPLAVKIGYDKAAAIAKEALEEGKTVRQLVREKGIFTEEELSSVLDPKNMI